MTIQRIIEQAEQIGPEVQYQFLSFEANRPEGFPEISSPQDCYPFGEYEFIPVEAEYGIHTVMISEFPASREGWQKGKFVQIAFKSRLDELSESVLEQAKIKYEASSNRDAGD